MFIAHIPLHLVKIELRDTLSSPWRSHWAYSHAIAPAIYID